MFGEWSTSGAAPIWPVFVIVAVLGTGRAFFQPASSALVPNLVPMEIFPNAVAWYTSATKCSQMVGPPLGGLLYLAGPAGVSATAFAFAAFVLAGAACAGPMHGIKTRKRKPIRTIHATPRPFRRATRRRNV